ncbi:hypothetical protein Sme01_57040 [Sphaerisporangium melleum]|uniref:Secreted protein n=2 Tax=Sphaerisporangium melleum TaxID=321316 RepID=A0A917R7R7_9ACTN|nr:hypothetical protein GCM10007964_40920 [Sphaerisporangium melleum]GII73228.1 hypothetical protein Sme01_57040 [Sphaerisporangium melleum]
MALRLASAAAGVALALGGPWSMAGEGTRGGAGVLEDSGGGGVLDGFVIGYVPPGAGPATSDFAYEPEDGVRFASRVWERETGEGHAVNLTVVVMRAGRFTTLGEVRGFLSAYHGRDPSSWTESQVGARPALASAGQVCWLAEPGVALSVTLDPTRFAPAEPLTVAESVRTA